MKSTSSEPLPRLSHDRSKGGDGASSPKFLGRMSWQKDVLETADTSSTGALFSLASPLAKPRGLMDSCSAPTLPLSPSTMPLLSAVVGGKPPLFGGNQNARKGGGGDNVLTYDESMEEVERMLREHMKEVQQQRTGGAKCISTLKQSADRRNPITREFEFAPLRDVAIIAATNELRSKKELFMDQEIDGDDDDEDDGEDANGDSSKSVTSDGGPANGLRKYFGTSAKPAYYKTYHELHGKPHLFIDKPKKRAQAKTLKASSSLSTALDLRKASVLKSLVQLTSKTPSNSAAATLALSTEEIAKRRLALQPMLRSTSTAHVSLMEVSSPSLHSPRVRFLSACIAKSHPAISMVLRKANCHAFDFSHQSLGDDFIIQFAMCLPDLPHVETINASDNRLSDNALNQLLLALENKPNLTKLDISQNEIGRESARSLRKYIASSLCTIKTLVLNDADIDDHECTLFMMAFEQNKSVEQLLMRSNRIGQTRKSMALGAASSAAMTLPGDSDAAGAPLPTGGEAIGSMLNVNLTIQELDLSWNMLRHSSAFPIATALLLNYNLRELNLSYNGCGDGGAMALGHALRSNAVLQKLNLAYNSIGGKGGLVLASGLIVNKGLKELVLDGNAIGLDSGRELMHASCSRIRSAAVCTLSMFECNLTTSKHSTATGGTTTAASSVNVYNPSDPAGSYNLDLSDPYEHMIAHELLRLATYKRGYKFTKLDHTTTPPQPKTTTKIELHRDTSRKPTTLVVSASSAELLARSASSAGVSSFSQNSLSLLFGKMDKDNSGFVDQKEIIEALQSFGITIQGDLLERVLHEYDYDHSGALGIEEFEDFFLRCGFAMIDTNHSGALDEQEVLKVMKLMGLDAMSDREIKQMIATYDLNGSGEIDEQEFVEFMKAEVLQKHVVMVPRADGAADPHPSIDTDSSASSAVAGSLEETYERTALRDASGVIWKIPSSGFLAVDFQYDPESCIVDTDDPDNAMFGCVTPSGDGRRGTRGRTASKMMLANTTISSLLDNAQKMSKSSVEQAEFFRAVLDMSDLFFTAVQAEQVMAKQGALKSWPRKRQALERMLPQMASRYDAATLVSRLVDSARQWQQRRDLRSAVPKLYAILCGCVTNRYRFDLQIAVDREALKQLATFAQSEKLFSKNRSGRLDTSQNGDWENFRNAKVNGHTWLLTSTFILNSLLGPTNLAVLGASSSGGGAGAASLSLMDAVHAKRFIEFDYVSTTRPPRGTKCITSRRFDQLLDVWMDSDAILKDDEKNHYHHPPVAAAAGGGENHGGESVAITTNAHLRWAILRNHVFARRHQQHLLFQGRSESSVVARMKSTLDGIQKKLELLEMLVSDRWLSCDQAATLIAVLPDAVLARARAAALLFSRIVDLEKFITIVDMLSMDDQKECVKRLGWLNILDPAQPDRQYPSLDLSIRDERELVQLLAKLTLTEGRGCWKRASYRSTATDITTTTANLGKNELPLPGWGNPEATGDESLKHHGFVRLFYDSPSSAVAADDQATTATTPREEYATAMQRRVELRKHTLCGTRLFLQ